ncbi:MAG: DedA family protein [Parachlamydiaceae bacterium]
MESMLMYICEHADQAHYIFFGLIMLAGFSVPISEDVMLLMAGAIGTLCGHEIQTIIHLYIWVFFACWLSAWEAYWMGRFLGPKLLTWRWFSHVLTPQRLEKLKGHLQRFGILTFIVGRFLPGGIRNALFMTSGLTKMPFSLFVLRDTGACLLASATLFYVGHLFGANFHAILSGFKTYQEVVFGILLVALVTFGCFKWGKKHFSTS